MATMIEARVPKDIRVYKTKVVGPFTLKQFFCVAAMIAVDVVIYNQVKDYEINYDVLMFIIVVIDMFFGAIGWVEPMGMTFFQYLKNVVLRSLIAPKNRKPKNIIYKTAKKTYSEKEKKAMDKRLKSLYSQHPEFVPYE